MNENLESTTIRHRDKVANDSSLSTSSSSTSSDAESSDTSSSTWSSSQTTTSSSSGSCDSRLSADRSVILNGPVIVLHQHHKPLAMINNETNDGNTSISSGSSSSSGSDEGGSKSSPISSSAHKRYRNSPFGLTNHYLAMPEAAKQDTNDKLIKRFYSQSSSGSKNKSKDNETNKKSSKKNSNSSDAKDRLSSSSSKKNDNNMIHNWSDANNKDSSSDPDLAQLSNDSLIKTTTTNCDLSVIGPSSIASQSSAQENTDWFSNNNSHHQHHHKQLKAQSGALDPIRYGPKHHSSSVVLAAGDAGLDAKKCNAKDNNNQVIMNDCGYYYPNEARSKISIDLHHNDNHLIGAKSPPKTNGQSHKTLSSSSSSGLLVRFSSIMYATFLVILGCILHISELRQKSMNSSDHIYTIIVAIMGIVWLLFLQIDLHRYKRYASKYILIETIFNDHRQKSLEAAQRRRDDILCDPSATSTTSSSASLVNDRMSMNTEVIFKKTAYKMYQQRAAMNKRHLKNQQHRQVYAAHRNRSNSKLSNSSGSDPASCDLGYKSDKGAGSVKESLSSSASSSNDLESHSNRLVPAYKFLHGKMGANFYLKCGMAAFCFGHVIHEGLRFGQQLYFFGTGNVHCRDSAALAAHLVTPLYSFYQLFMMFKYSNLVINRHKVLACFGLMHIIGTSVTFWFRTIIEEAFEDFVHKMDYFRTNKPQLGLTFLQQHQPVDNQADLNSLLASISQTLKAEASERADQLLIGAQNRTVSVAKSLLALMTSPISSTITPQMARHLPESYACAQNTLLTTKSMNALPYLYPFTIEYNLLLAATFLSLYFNIGKIGVAGESDDNCDSIVPRSHLYDHDAEGKMRAGSGMSSSRMSHVEFPGSDTHSSSAIRMRGESAHTIGEYKSNFVVNADCHAANKGLFCGFFVLLVTLVTIVIFFVTINKPSHVQLGIKINLIQEAALTSLILIVTLAAFKQVVKLNRNPLLKDKVTTDDVLMLIPLPFFFIHSLLSFRAETAAMYSSGTLPWASMWASNNPQALPTASSSSSTTTLQSILLNASNSQIDQVTRQRLNILLSGIAQNSTSKIQLPESMENNRTGTRGQQRNLVVTSTVNNNSNNNSSGTNQGSKVDHFKLVTLALNLIVMIEVLVQTNFIIDGMRRCSESRYLRFKKPGRELITFAIILNITYWIVATFETKSVEQYKTEIEFYGPLPYMFISHTTLPVMLFYRYHSSVCLTEIWNRAYKPPKKR